MDTTKYPFLFFIHSCYFIQNIFLMDILLNHKGEIAAILTAVCWTFTGLAFEYAGKKIGSLTVNLIRLFIGFIFLGIYTFLTSGNFFPVDADSHAWIWLSLSGVVGFLIGDLMLFQAFVVTGARVSMLIMSLAPPITALFGWIILGEGLSVLNIFGMIITISGIAIVILSKSQNSGKKISTQYPIKGILLAFGGAAGQGLGLVLSKLGMKELDPFVSTQIRVIVGFIGFALFFTFTKRWYNVSVALRNKKAMVGTTIGSFFGPFLGVSLSLLALKYTTAGVASTLNSLSPIIIIPLAWFLFRERITIRDITGSIIAVVGVVLFFI